MGSRPIDLTASAAAPELFVVEFRERFESLNYFGLGNLSQPCVAAKATCERSDRTKKIKATDHFDRLFVSVL